MTDWWALAGPVGMLVVFGGHYLAKSYCRVYGVEEANATVYTAARPIGVAVGALLWTALRLLTPDFTPAAGDAGLLLNGLASFALSAVLLGVLDVVVHRVFVEEPSYGEAREAFFEHGSSRSDGEDWIDVALSDTEGR